MSYKSYDKDKIKKNLSLEQVFQLIEFLGGNPKYIPQGFTAETICHNEIGLGSRKLYYYDNTKLFHCYTECGSMDIFEVFIRAKENKELIKLNLYDAIKYIVNFFSLPTENFLTEGSKSTLSDLKILDSYNLMNKSKESIEIKYNIYNDQVLNNLSFMIPSLWMEEGITVDTMKKYNIKYYGTNHQIIIPHYNLYNELIGIRGRTLVKEDIELYGKYVPVKINGTLYNHPLSQNLFGLNLNINNIRKCKKIIIFEGEKSVLLYDSLFGSNNNISVATCGSSISSFQYDLIKNECQVDEIIIAYDKEFETLGDNNFKKNIKLLINLAKKVQNYCTVSIIFDKYNVLNYKDAPIDQGKEIFEFLFCNRISQGVF